LVLKSTAFNQSINQSITQSEAVVRRHLTRHSGAVQYHGKINKTVSKNSKITSDIVI